MCHNTPYDIFIPLLLLYSDISVTVDGGGKIGHYPTQFGMTPDLFKFTFEAALLRKIHFYVYSRSADPLMAAILYPTYLAAATSHEHIPKDRSGKVLSIRM
jgi:hypothetical protein